MDSSDPRRVRHEGAPNIRPEQVHLDEVVGPTLGQDRARAWAEFWAPMRQFRGERMGQHSTPASVWGNAMGGSLGRTRGSCWPIVSPGGGEGERIIILPRRALARNAGGGGKSRGQNGPNERC